jgi:hypothetical protein
MTNEEGKPVTRAEVEAIVLYGVLALVAGGAAGIYIPYFMGKPTGVDALATYVFAVLAPIFADMLLYEAYWKKLTKVLKLRLGLAGSVAGILAICSLLAQQKAWAIPVGFGAMLLVLPIWFFLAVYSGRFRPEEFVPPPKGSIGGEEVDSGDLAGEGLPS